jgi:hypothetical protein
MGFFLIQTNLRMLPDLDLYGLPPNMNQGYQRHGPWWRTHVTELVDNGYTKIPGFFLVKGSSVNDSNVCLVP